MGKKQNKPVKTQISQHVTKQTAVPPSWLMPLILLLSFLCYLPALKAGFVNWDDPDYVTENILIRNWSDISALVTTPVQGNHHPLTMLSLAFNYSISGDEAWSYHWLNIILHLLNCVLVYKLVKRLSGYNLIIAFTASLFFGIHPMHVESVAWISERKDVLYSAFYLLGLISYTRYVDERKKSMFWISVLLMLLSLLSKPAAVVFPLSLLCIDLLRNRPFRFSLIFEKVPFGIIAIIGAILTYLAQKQAGTTGGIEFSTMTRILMPFYGIMVYVVKCILPIQLSPFYPYAPINEALPVTYYIAPLISVFLAWLFFRNLKKERIVSFGIAFFIVNLLLVLQVIPVGSAVIAERYTYIPYIGLFIIFGWIISRLTKNEMSASLRYIVPVAMIFCILAYNQVSIWTSSTNLWDAAVKNEPSATAFGNRGLLYRKDGDTAKAMEYYNNAISLNAVYHEAFCNRGNIYFNRGQFDLASADYRRALNIKADYYPALDNMGALHAMNGRLDSSLVYLDSAIKIRPNYYPPYRNRAYTHLEMKRYREAIKDLETYATYKPESSDIYNTIGSCYRSLKQWNESIQWINKAIEMDPQPVYYLNRSYTYAEQNNTEAARRDFITAKQGGAAVSPEYARSLGF